MPEGDSNTRCWRVRWTRPSIVARPKQAPYAKSSSSSEEAARANRRPRRKCKAPIIEQYAATRPQHEGSTKLYALLSYPCCSTTERAATENVAASPTAAISSRTQAGRSRDRGLDRKAGQLAITFAELHSTRRWAGYFLAQTLSAPARAHRARSNSGCSSCRDDRPKLAASGWSSASAISSSADGDVTPTAVTSGVPVPVNRARAVAEVTEVHRRLRKSESAYMYMRLVRTGTMLNQRGTSQQVSILTVNSTD